MAKREKTEKKKNERIRAVINTRIEAWAFFGVDGRKLKNGDKNKLDETVRRSGFGLISSHLGQFPGGSFTYTAILAESDSKITVGIPPTLGNHTWEEHGVVVILLHYCNLNRDNADKAKKFFELLRADLKPSSYSLRGIPWDIQVPA